MSTPDASRDSTVADALALVPDKYRGQVSWGDRADGRHWQARVGPYSTIGNGGPYPTAADAIAAAARLAVTPKGRT